MTPVIGQNDNPILLDRAYNEINQKLIVGLPWLTNAFGRAYHITTRRDNIEHIIPGVYVDNKEYLSMLPSDEHGNFSFFVLDDPQNFGGQVQNGRGVLKAQINIVFWFNIVSIFGDDEIVNSEQVKYDILKILSSPATFTKGRITVKEIYEKPENVYKSFGLKDVETNYLMSPYYGFRFKSEIMLKEVC